MSATKEKILLLLLAGTSLGFTHQPYRQWKILNQTVRAWKNIDKKELRKEIKNLYKSKMISQKTNNDGSFTIFLTDKGKAKALTYHFQEMVIKKDNWDGKWRIVVFDIPERLRKGRDALRLKIKELGFYELQKSVFVFPYECKDEIDFVVEFFNLRKYVRFGILEKIDNDIHLRKIFNLK